MMRFPPYRTGCSTRIESPQGVKSHVSEEWIRSNDAETVNRGLSGEEAIKGIAMRAFDCGGANSLIQAKRQHMPSFTPHLSGEIDQQRSRNLQFPGADFLKNLIARDRAEKDLDIGI